MLGCMIESSVLISAAAHLAELADFLDLDGNPALRMFTAGRKRRFDQRLDGVGS